MPSETDQSKINVLLGEPQTKRYIYDLYGKGEGKNLLMYALDSSSQHCMVLHITVDYPKLHVVIFHMFCTNSNRNITGLSRTC